jgi:hypothetical protein
LRFNARVDYYGAVKRPRIDGCAGSPTSALHFVPPALAAYTEYASRHGTRAPWSWASGAAVAPDHVRRGGA